MTFGGTFGRLVAGQARVVVRLAVVGFPCASITLAGCAHAPGPERAIEPQRIGVREQAIVELQKCIGDNDAPTDACFRGFSAKDSDWVKDPDDRPEKEYYGDSARISDSCWPSPAVYAFRTGVLGEVWFSAWIPSQNATWHAKYTVECKNLSETVSNENVFTIPQGTIFGRWETIGSLGYWESGSTCTVKVQEDGLSCKYSVAADGLKMTIYQ